MANLRQRRAVCHQEPLVSMGQNIYLQIKEVRNKHEKGEEPAFDRISVG